MSNRRNTKPSKDKGLPFLTPDEAGLVRRLMHNGLAERGFKTTVHSDHLKTADGKTFGLWNVAARCHAAGGSAQACAAVVADHLAKLMSTVGSGNPFDGLTAEDAVQRTISRVVTADQLAGDLTDFPHRVVAPGLMEVLVLDVGMGVVPYNRERLDRVGGWDALHHHGRVNLQARCPDDFELLALPGGGSFFAMHDPSMHTASQVLLLPEMLAPLGGHLDLSNGWVWSVPNRTELCWYIVGLDDPTMALPELGRWTRQRHEIGEGPLSPELFWWRDGANTLVDAQVEHAIERLAG